MFFFGKWTSISKLICLQKVHQPVTISSPLKKVQSSYEGVMNGKNK